MSNCDVHTRVCSTSEIDVAGDINIQYDAYEPEAQSVPQRMRSIMFWSSQTREA